MVAAAATIAVVYPHMNGLGGDAFWLISRPGAAPVGISCAGRAAALATAQSYRAKGYDAIPPRGPDAALLVPGAVASWQLALELDPASRMPLGALLAQAIAYARDGIAVSASQTRTTAKAQGLKGVEGFDAIYLPEGEAPVAGTRLVQSALGGTLEHLATHGPDSFYRGDLAATHGRFLRNAGSPLRQSDFAALAPAASPRSPSRPRRVPSTTCRRRPRASPRC